MSPKNPLKDLLQDTRGAANISTLAKEGIVSLLISIVANETTSTLPRFSLSNMLRLLIVFFVVFSIIHFSLKIMKLPRRRKEKLEKVQEANTRKVLKNLSIARTILDRLIQTSSEVTELRGLRNKLTTLISELQNPNLEKFSRKSAPKEEFDATEKLMVENSEKLAQELERRSKEGVDGRAIAQLIDSVGDAIHSRIPLTNEMKDLYLETKKREQQEKKKIPKDASPELNLYLNALLTKYASYRPEILHAGDYVANMKWEYSAGDKNVTAKLSDGFMGNPLILEARWQDDGAVVEVAQKESEAVKKNQYKCLCLVNTAWGKESKDFAVRFSHPKLALYLYELNRGLFFKDNPAARHYEFWFNTEQKHETFKERALEFIQAHEYFTAQDIVSALGIKTEGAEALLASLEKEGAIIDVSFKSDKIKKYTKARPKGN